MRTTIALPLAFALCACSRVTPSASASPPPAATTAASASASTGAALVVQSPARTELLAVGDPAPQFHGVAANGAHVDVGPTPRARTLVVYFYPRDETPGCTIEANAFRDAHQVYEQAGADVLGISTDTDEAHRAFAQHYSLPFPLLSDPQGAVAAAFGVAVNNRYAHRTTFVIDRRGRIAQVFATVNPNGHADEVIAAVRALH